MTANENNLRTDRDDQSANKSQTSGMEGEAMGGHKFGEEGKATPMGDDAANPSRYAGNTNPYFNRAEPLDEDTANNNFKAEHQQGEPDIDAASPSTANSNLSTPGEANYTKDSENKPDYGSQSPETQDHIET